MSHKETDLTLVQPSPQKKEKGITDSKTESVDLTHLAGLSNKIWRGTSKQAKSNTNKVLNTGYKTLNEQLHSKGWPVSATTELGLSQPGIGELRLLLPALRQLQEASLCSTNPHNIIWVAPPFLPYAPELIKEHLDIAKLTVVQTKTMQDTLWATEQALLSESCAAVFTWTGSYNLSTRELRRLQLAAEKAKCWHVLLRHSDCMKQASTSGLRLHLQANLHGTMDVHILKQPNGWGGQRCTLSLYPHYEKWQRLPVHLLPHHNKAHTRILPERIETLNNQNHEQASVTVLSPLSVLKTVH